MAAGALQAAFLRGLNVADINSEAIRVGRLRWHVQIGTRTQVASGDAELVDEFTILAKVWAEIEPVGAQTFLAGTQTDTPFTHRIFMRWLDWVDQTHVVIRNSKRPDSSTRLELFRVRRVGELAGRKRFLMIEAEQEMRR
jgi:head-tail adaptor